MVAVRSLYAAREPSHVLRPGERIVGTVERLGIMTQWIIVRERAKREAKRRHDGRLRKR